jgi:hypothetical protein
VSIKLRYPLAFNLDGAPVRIPPNAWAWRVRRVENGSLAHRRGGECKLVKGADGSPLYIRLDSPIDRLIADVTCGGLYRLDAVSRSLAVLRELEPVYVEVPPKTRLESFAMSTDWWAASGGLIPLLPRSQQARATPALEGRHANS